MYNRIVKNYGLKEHIYPSNIVFVKTMLEVKIVYRKFSKYNEQ